MFPFRFHSFCFRFFSFPSLCSYREFNKKNLILRGKRHLILQVHSSESGSERDKGRSFVVLDTTAYKTRSEKVHFTQM